MWCCCPTWARPPSRAAWIWARRSSSTSRPSATATSRPTACWRRCSSARRSLDFHRAAFLPQPAPIAEIDRAGDVVAGCHQAQEALHQIVDVAEGAGLGAIAEDGDGLALEGLDDEVGDHAPIVGMHARTVGIEDPRHFDAQPVL